MKKPDNHLFKLATDNGMAAAKIAQRRWLLDQMGGAANCKVLELFGGMGVMHDACYTEVKQHMAFELRKVERPTWVCGDARLLLNKHVQGWDLYDVDSYSNPWMLAKTICKLRKPGRFAMALTCGAARGLKATAVTGYLLQASGYYGMKLSPLMYRFYPQIINLMFNDWAQYGVSLEAGVKCVGFKAQTHYYGVVLNKE